MAYCVGEVPIPDARGNTAKAVKAGYALNLVWQGKAPSLAIVQAAVNKSPYLAASGALSITGNYFGIRANAKAGVSTTTKAAADSIGTIAGASLVYAGYASEGGKTVTVAQAVAGSAPASLVVAGAATQQALNVGMVLGVAALGYLLLKRRRA